MRRLLLCLIALLVFGEAYSQTPTPNDSSSVRNDFSLYLKLTGRTITSPLRWNSCDWWTAGGVITATGAAALLDNEVYSLMGRNQNHFNSRVSDVVVEYGSGATAVAMTGGMYIAGLAFENRWLRETSVLMASALTVSVATEFALKFAVGRARPYTGLGNSTFKPFNGKADFLSFPSGHTVVAFTLSTVLSERIKNIWASIGLYGLSTLVATSRMYTRHHWLSDVVFAGALSTFVARSVVHYYENGMREGSGATGLRIIPKPNGVMVVWRF